MAKKVISPVETAQFLVDAGFVGWQVVRFGQIAMAESGLNAYAVNVVDNPSSPAHLSLDVGLMQINTYWWPHLSIAQRLDPALSARAAFEIFVQRGGLADPIKGYNGWTTYTNGAFMQFQKQAIDAARAVGAY